MADNWVKVGTTKVYVRVKSTGERGVLDDCHSEIVYFALSHSTPLRVILVDGSISKFAKEQLELIG